MGWRRGDLIDTYRTAVRWGFYEEAARLHRTMIGLDGEEPERVMAAELRALERRPPIKGFRAALREFFARSPRV